MPFSYTTPFPRTDPACAAHFTRSFEHVDWIDGESIVQAESSPTEEGFNARFHKIISDLDALATDARRGLECTAQMRQALFDRFGEVATAIDQATTPVEGWRQATLQNGWQAKALDTDFDYHRPAYFRDHRAGSVHLRGQLGNGPVPSAGNRFSSVMLTLPAGYRPSARTVLFALTSGNQVVRLDVTEEGQVNLRAAYSSWVSLDGISFRP